VAEREYICSYSHCLHGGAKVKRSEAVVVGRRHYHWDCAAMKQELEEIRNIYAERIDANVSFPILSKVLNDLVFKYEVDIGYLKFAVNYYAEYKVKVKSPFTLLYLRKNDYMLDKWERYKGR
jgi:hypothetical protein